MKNKTICISDDTYAILKKESNASQLVERLLQDYFKTNAPIVEQLKEKVANIEQLKEKIITEQQETNKIILEVKEKEKTEQELDDAKKKRQATRVKDCQQLFKNEGFETSPEFISEYLDNFDKGKANFYGTIAKLRKKNG